MPLSPLGHELPLRPAPDGRNPDYPPELQAAEEAALRERRSRNGIAPNAPQVGFALSGGGIRSATFCLGVFQALARLKMVRRIDYLSTVSGGGYFGSFLGTAFTRESGSADEIERELSDNHSWSVCWLRENGRFLSPNGSGDNWMTAAVALRNWITLHLVILTFAYFLIGLGTLLRVELCATPLLSVWWTPVEHAFWMHSGEVIWWSPWLILPALPLVFVMVPTALVYWSTQMPAIVAVARWLTGLVRSSTRAMANAEFATRAQILLTRGFMLGFASAVGLLVFALVDTVGQSAYRRWAAESFEFPAIWATLTGGGFALYGLASKVVVYLERFLGRKRFRITFDVVALGLAFLWLSLILCGLSVIAAGFAWRWQPVRSGGAYQLMSGSLPLLLSVAVAFLLSWIFSRSFGFVNLSSMQQMYAARLARAYLGATNPIRRRHANHNMTDLLPGDEVPLEGYAPHAHGGPLHLVNVTVNETISGRTQIERRDRKGLPMAVGPCGISVGTDAHALWAPHDPCAKPSTKLQALWECRTREMIPILPDDLLAQSAHGSHVPWGRAAINRKAVEHPRIEALSLGRWTAISGAAFTTGTGANTNVGLSLLLGLANVRLGYWWNSGIPPRKRPRGAARPNFAEIASRIIAAILPVQSCLVNEFFARFHGPARRHWYLSDGGHFENTGCYELIRRRIPFIVCVDAGQDPNYQFEDLANLFRKARTDFGAEIQIVRRGGEARDDPGVRHPMPTLEELIHPALMDVIGSPDDFPGPVDTTDGEEGPRPNARRHGMLARIHYLDTDTFSWLLLIKPGLMGDEALDVLQYQRAHPLFPQEPTADQYFDEAQWESYRKLGEHIGVELFTPPASRATNTTGRWTPSQMRPPEEPVRACGADHDTLVARLGLRERDH